MSEIEINKNRIRVAIGSFFFLHCLCFSSWGSRVTTVQENLNLSELQLGTLLFAVPVGSIFSILSARYLIHKFGSKNILISALFLYSLVLIFLGLSQSVFQLAICLLFFGFLSNISDVAMNTQAVYIESMYKRSIMASLHGLWSLAGFFGALIGTLMIGFEIVPLIHFSIVFVLILIGIVANTNLLLPDKTTENENSKSGFKLPERKLFYLGLITFCSMICEGTMFDWSGVYFNKVVQAKPELIGVGYTAFMTTMAGTRFIADRFSTKFGLKKTLTVSSLLIGAGLLISSLFPSFLICILGFALVGIGTSSVVPLAISEAGRIAKGSVNSSVATVVNIGFFGFLVGPPFIGWIADKLSLRSSFMIVAFVGLLIAFLVPRVFKTAE